MDNLPGGEGGISTLDKIAPIPHFECGALDRTMRPLQRNHCNRLNQQIYPGFCMKSMLQSPLFGNETRQGRRFRRRTRSSAG